MVQVQIYNSGHALYVPFLFTHILNFLYPPHLLNRGAYMAWSFRTTPKRFLSHWRFLWEVLYCIAKIARVSKIINYFSSASLLLLVLIIIIIIFMTSWSGWARGSVKYACAQTGATNACCGSLRRRRRRRRLFRSTTDFSRIFFRPLPPYYPPECYAAPPSTAPDIFVPCRRPFVVFLSSAGFRSYRHTSRKTPPAVSCCRWAIKDNRNISVIFFPFSALSWDVFEWAQLNRVSRTTTLLNSVVRATRRSHDTFAPQWITYCLVLFHKIYIVIVIVYSNV